MRFLLKLIGLILGLFLTLWASIALWGTLSPVVVLHYASDATKPLGYFLNDNLYITKAGLKPGETRRFPTAMFAAPDSWIELSTPFINRDGVEIHGKFSRVDICIDANAKFRTEIRHGFFERFTDPEPPCDPSPKR